MGQTRQNDFSVSSLFYNDCYSCVNDQLSRKYIFDSCRGKNVSNIMHLMFKKHHIFSSCHFMGTPSNDIHNVLDILKGGSNTCKTK